MRDIVFQRVSFKRSTCPFPCGFLGVVRLVAIPLHFKKDWSSSDIKYVPLSEWIYWGIQKIENSCDKLWITVLVVISRHGNAKGKQENSSIRTNKYLLFELDGKGPLKSILILSNG